MHGVYTHVIAGKILSDRTADTEHSFRLNLKLHPFLSAIILGGLIAARRTSCAIILRKGAISSDAMVEAVVMRRASGCNAGCSVEVPSSNRTSSSWSTVGLLITESPEGSFLEGINGKSC